MIHEIFLNNYFGKQKSLIQFLSAFLVIFNAMMHLILMLFSAITFNL